MSEQLGETVCPCAEHGAQYRGDVAALLPGAAGASLICDRSGRHIQEGTLGAQHPWEHNH